MSCRNWIVSFLPTEYDSTLLIPSETLPSSLHKRRLRLRMQRRSYRLGLRTRILGGDANWRLGMSRGDQLPPGQKRLNKISAAGRFLWNCAPWTKDDVFLPGDLKPFWIDMKNMIGKLGNKSWDIIGNPQTQENPGP